MQNKKKSKIIKKKKTHSHKKNYQNKDKFSKNQPASKSSETTQQKKRIVSNNDKITKTINKNIQKTIMQRAVIGKQKFSFLKPGQQ